MRGVREWLEDLGLGAYADAFEREDVDFDALRQLSNEDLKELGLTMGARKKLLTAIEALAPASEPDAPTHPRDAERRQITVMFCDLVGSTALSEKLDPEDLRTLMQAYQEACGKVIERYGGHVAQYLGDGLMTYFGWPQAHEDDAERSIRAGLEIIEAVKTVAAPAPLQVRIGIATGPVVVGETGAGDASVPKLAVGETPNLAARLQGLAEADEIVIGETTNRLVGGAFDRHSLGKHTVKGIDNPITVWRVTGTARTESRFEAVHTGGLTPFVGRDSEIAMILERWQQAKDGEGQLVLLCGEPGIGKSRITEILNERMADEPHLRLRYQCSPYYTNSAFYPLIEQFERAAGFSRDDTADDKIGKMERTLALGTTRVSDAAPLIAAMLSLPTDQYPPLGVEPQKQKEMTIAALTDQVIGLADREPVIIIFEDAHWIDPTTLEALSVIIDRIQDHPVLVVVTYRPEFAPPWSERGHATTLTLNRLAQRQCAAMVATVTGGKPLPDEVLDQIVAKTDGVPLFVEELTKTVLEAGFLKDAGDRYILDGPLPPLAIPSTLHDSLMARLDRLSPVKEVAQVGACIGREFSYELLAAVSPLRDNELQESLTQLVNSALIFRRGTPPDATYTFKHALVQDAAYESLLKSKRQQLHTNIAKILENQFPDRVIIEPELAAHHFTAAGLLERAVPYWLASGQNAIGRFANEEANAHLSKGLELLATFPNNRERDEQELTFRTTLGFALISYKSYVGPEVLETYGRAWELCERLGTTPQTLPVLFGLWAYYLISADYPTAKLMAERFLDVAESSSESDALVAAHTIMAGSTLFGDADVKATLDHVEKGLALYDRDNRVSAQVYGQAFGPWCADWSSWALWMLGYPDQAMPRNRLSLELAADVDHPLTYASQLAHAAIFHSFRGDASATYDLAHATIEKSNEIGIPLRTIEGYMLKGWAMVEQGDHDAGIDLLLKGIDDWRSIGANIANPLWFALLAQAYNRLGKHKDALETIDHAIRTMEHTGERLWEAELNRLKGEFLLVGDHPDAEAAAAHFERAIEVAKAQETKSWELRAAISLARLWQGQSKARQAHDLLAPVYGWFTEGFDTSELKEAKALLAELEAT